MLDLSLSDLVNFRLLVGGEMTPVTLGPSVCLLLTCSAGGDVFTALRLAYWVVGMHPTLGE